MTLRVLYSFPFKFGRTGIGVTARQQVRGLVEQGARVTLAAGVIERPVEGVEYSFETMRLGGVRMPHRVVGKLNALRYHDRRVASALRRSSDRIDIVHAWPTGALQTLDTARRFLIPSVLERPNTHSRHAHEVVQAEYLRLGMPMEECNTHAFDPRRMAREEAEYAAAWRLACPSEAVAASFREFGYPESRLLRHRYGCDAERFLRHTGTAKSASQDRPFTVVFVGRCEPRKGLHFALRAWADSTASRHGRFWICGEFSPGYESCLGPLLRSSGVQSLGFVRNVEERMRDADVLVLSSVEEGSALVTYEARACGCVLAVSEAAGAMARHDHDALVHPVGDSTQLTQDFDRLSGQPDLLDRLRTHSLAAADDLSWSAAGQVLHDKLRGVVSAWEPTPYRQPEAPVTQTDLPHSVIPSH
ncbi:MAG: glycosyltransferase family 4 protein [Planctomycetota bacterium]